MSTPTSIRTYRPAGSPEAVRDWRHHATCRTAEPELFFPLPGQSPAPALAWCADCPVQARCLQDALDGGHGGVRGGMTEDARRELRRGRRSGR